uniref:ABC transporter permease n=1 Tax=Prevotella sp. GTC17260 TaxID=3236796 RepID=A0AB33JHC2_9BACT
MAITIGGLIAGLMLLMIPLFVIYRFNLGLLRQLAVSVAKMVVYVGLLGIFVGVLMRWDSVVLNILWVLLVAVLGAASVLMRAKLNVARFIVPVSVGLFTAALVVGLYFVFLVLKPQSPLSAQFFLPLTGLLLGAMLEVNAKALHIYYIGIRNHHQLYDYLLGNGATHGEAVGYFVRRALQRSLTPCLSRMALIVVAHAPVMMWMLLPAGVDIWTAVGLEILVHVAALAGVCISMVVTLFVARRYAFDGYGRLKNVA